MHCYNALRHIDVHIENCMFFVPEMCSPKSLTLFHPFLFSKTLIINLLFKIIKEKNTGKNVEILLLMVNNKVSEMVIQIQ